MFLSKLDSAGSFVWARRLGSSSDDVGGQIAAAADGYVYSTGYFCGTADFDPGSGQLRLMINEGVIGRIEVEGGIIRVAEGWARGADIDKGARWDPAELRPVVADLLAKSRPPLPVFGA